jgi:hypothetical protein
MKVDGEVVEPLNMHLFSELDFRLIVLILECKHFRQTTTTYLSNKLIGLNCQCNQLIN